MQNFFTCPKNYSLVVFFGLSLFLGNAHSNELSYSYFEFGFANFEDDSLGVDLDGDGTGFTIGFELAENFAVSYSSTTGETDAVLGITFEQDATALGLIGHTSVTPTTDLFASYQFVNIDVAVTDGIDEISDDDNGNAISFGIRSLVSENVEFNLELTQLDIFDDTSTSNSLGARWYVSEGVAFGINLTNGEDIQTWTYSAAVFF